MYCYTKPLLPYKVIFEKKEYFRNNEKDSLKITKLAFNWNDTAWFPWMNMWINKSDTSLEEIELFPSISYYNIYKLDKDKTITISTIIDDSGMKLYFDKNRNIIKVVNCHY